MPRLPPGGVDELDDDAIRLETVSLALRTREGIAVDTLTPDVAQARDAAVDAGLLEPADGRLRLSARGRLLAAEVAIGLAG
jgi:oxygen-independent coproporphyrinogen-3 oxidase